MLKKELESTISRLLAIGVPAVSLFILTGSVTDPVNETKFLLLGAVGVAALSVVLFRGLNMMWVRNRALLILSGLFLLFSIFSVLQSKSPLSQNLYGVYGRNTGFLTYFFLLGILLAASIIKSRNSLNSLCLGLFFTGLINVLYCGWAVFVGDFISWNNPYGNILGLFGNPNFIGAFLGIWISATVGYSLGQKLKAWQWILISSLILLACYEVYKSHAVQGVVVTAGGLATVGFFFIRSRTKGIAVLAAYTSSVLVFGIVALMGALQKGPLAEIVYKTSVSLRGIYWNAGIKTGMDHPFTGAGFDSYGDWYRRSRSEYGALVLPGPRVTTNSAHNVILDIFSYGGFPLLISYLGMVLLGALAIIKVLRRSKDYDPVFVALCVAWIGYQLQSIISINQIGLAVWGWLLTGALIAYVNLDAQSSAQESVESSSKRKPNQQVSRGGSAFSTQLIAGVGAVLGLILSAPPISADMAWVKATQSRNAQEVEKALTPTYLHPSNSERYTQAIQLLENSGLFEQAHKYAQTAVKFNPDHFGSWFTLYSVSKSTDEEKALALKNLKRLDPYSKDVLNP